MVCDGGLIENPIGFASKRNPPATIPKTKAATPFRITARFVRMVPKAGLEPARVSPPPPQDGVSTKFHHFGKQGGLYSNRVF